MSREAVPRSGRLTASHNSHRNAKIPLPQIFEPFLHPTTIKNSYDYVKVRIEEACCIIENSEEETIDSELLHLEC